MDVDVRGVIVPDDEAWIYDWFGYEYTAPGKIRKAAAEAAGEALDVYINSGGGDVFSGSDIYSTLRSYKGEVRIHVTGIAASAASVIACARHSDIAPTAQLMVHNVSTIVSGDVHTMEHTAETLRQANRSIAAAYVEKTGMTEKEALHLMDKETWLTAEDAVKYGLIDEIAQEAGNENLPMVASVGEMLPRAVIDRMKQTMERETAALELLKLRGVRT